MASSTYGRKLNPYRRLRNPLGVKGVRQSVVVTNNPSNIDQNQQLLVRFPNLGAHDVVVPGTARLAFTVSLTSTDANQTIVKNVGLAVVKKTTIKISGNEVLSIDDSDVLHCYQDLWKAPPERANSHYQGIDLSDDQNVTRIRVGAGNKDDVKADWTPWILVGAGLAALCVWRSPLVKLKLTEGQQKPQHPEARSSGTSQPPPTPRCAQHLKAPDPFHME